jgi:hypothetical protein
VGVEAPVTLGNFALTEITGLVHWISSHLIWEPLGRSGTKEGAAEEQSLQDGSRRKDVTIRLFGTSGLEEGTV